MRSHASSEASALYTSGRASLKNAWSAASCTCSVTSLPRPRSIASNCAAISGVKLWSRAAYSPTTLASSFDQSGWAEAHGISP